MIRSALTKKQNAAKNKGQLGLVRFAPARNPYPGAAINRGISLISRATGVNGL